MLRDLNELHGHRIQATDGNIGHVKEFYFDDEKWVVRYLVVDTGHLFSGRKVLISPEAFGKPDYVKKKFPVILTKEQIEKSPNIEEHRPVSREHEYELNEYYGWKIYWADGPHILDPAQVEPKLKEYKGDPHLQSTHEVTGYHVHAVDGDIGHIENFIIEDDSWTIRYIEIDTINLLPGKKVLFSPLWIEKCNCHERKVYMSLCRNEIKNSPKFHSLTSVNREYEEKLFDHYKKPKYWERI